MNQIVNLTRQVQIAERPYFTATETFRVKSVTKVSIVLPSGVADRAVHVMSGGNGEVALLMVNASQFFDPSDTSKTLLVKGATDGNSLHILAPFSLADVRLLKALLGEQGVLFFTNPMQSDVAVEILVCQGITIDATSPSAMPSPLLAPWIAQPQDAPQAIMATHDDLTRIKGIGPIYQQRLQQAGIHTFAQLVSASISQLEATIGAQPWQAVDVASWIEQAQALAAENG